MLASIDDGLPVASLTAVEPAPFPMYGLARETVLDVLADCGVRTSRSRTIAAAATTG